VAVFNHHLPFRPLRAGVAVLNPIVNKIGTIGCIATSNGHDRWLVSCYHVLGRIDFSAFNDGEPIFQPVDGMGPPVAKNSVARILRDLGAAVALHRAGTNSGARKAFEPSDAGSESGPAHLIIVPMGAFPC